MKDKLIDGFRDAFWPKSSNRNAGGIQSAQGWALSKGETIGAYPNCGRLVVVNRAADYAWFGSGGEVYLQVRAMGFGESGSLPMSGLTGDTVNGAGVGSIPQSTIQAFTERIRQSVSSEVRASGRDVREGGATSLPSSVL